MCSQYYIFVGWLHQNSMTKLKFGSNCEPIFLLDAIELDTWFFNFNILCSREWKFDIFLCSVYRGKSTPIIYQRLADLVTEILWSVKTTLNHIGTHIRQKSLENSLDPKLRGDIIIFYPVIDILYYLMMEM